MLLALSVAFAASPDLDSPAAREALIQLVERRELPCTTPVVAALGLAWPELTPEQRERVNRAVRPPTGSLVGGTLRPRLAAPPAKDSCWSVEDNRIVGEHFVVEYEDGVSAAVARTFLDDLEYSWQVEIDELGWRAPDGSDDYLILAVITNERTGGAYTWYESCGGEAIPYFVSGKDSWDDAAWGATMAAHEFNHAIQMGYGWANEFWWWEATATWVEDHVYPATDYWAYYVQGYTESPHIAMSASNQQDSEIFWHMYGMSVLAFHLDDHFGGHDTVMGTWEDAEGQRGMYSRSPEEMVQERGLDWDEVYADFTARNTLMDYEQQRAFPRVSVEDEVDRLPAEGSSSRNTAPQGYGQNYIFIEAGLGEGELVLQFEGDRSVTWLVQLVEASRGVVGRVEAARSEEGAAELRLPGYGDEDVYLVVSPLEHDDNDRSYSWSLRLEAGGGDTGADTGDTGADTGDTGVDDTDDTDGPGLADEDAALDLSSDAGCGCASGDAGAMLGAGLLATALVARRRR